MKEFDHPYDAELACDLIGAFFESGEADLLSSALAELAPLVSLVSRTSIDIPQPLMNEARVDALSRVYELILTLDIPVSSSRVFTRFMWTLVLRSLADSLRFSQPQVFNCWKKCFDPVTSSIKPDIADLTIYAMQLRSRILDLADEEIRFGGKEKSACKYIASCLLGFTKRSPLTVKHEYRLSKTRAEYLVKYMRILIKSITYWFREFDESL